MILAIDMVVTFLVCKYICGFDNKWTTAVLGMITMYVAVVIVLAEMGVVKY